MSSGALAFSHLTLSEYKLRRSNIHHRTNNIRCTQSVITSEARSAPPTPHGVLPLIRYLPACPQTNSSLSPCVSTGRVKSWDPVYEQLATSDKIACLHPFLCHCCYQTSQWCLKPALMWLKAHLNLISFFFLFFALTLSPADRNPLYNK